MTDNDKEAQLEALAESQPHNEAQLQYNANCQRGLGWIYG